MTELKEGNTLTATKREVTRDQLRQYANASLDMNPIHLDEDFAKSVGFDSVIAHGMLSMAFLADHLQRNFAPKARVVRLKTKFRKITYPGDQLSCEGVIKKKLESGEYLVSVWIANQKGERATDGEAVVSLVS